jgi:hypothetical protein
MRAVIFAAAAVLVCLAAHATAAPAGEQSMVELEAEPLRRYPAEEARQGVAVTADRFYAIDNSRIAAYDRETGERQNQWSGDPEAFPHLNSCLVVNDELVCASSNYPAVPMASSIEWFDASTLEHLRSYSLGPGTGSITWLVPREGFWWAGFANYEGRGGEPGRDYRFTTLVQYDADFQRRQSWLFPDSVLERMAPRSASGGVWGDDGLLYVTGHDLPELYVLALPDAGATLRHVATIAMPTAGQAIAWDPDESRVVWSINRPSHEVVTSRIPAALPLAR